MSLHKNEEARSPLEAARSRLGLTIAHLAEVLDCSDAAVSRYLSGQRTPPAALAYLLGGGDVLARHERWREATGRKRSRGAVTLEITTRLPKGMTAAQARERCLAALAVLAGEGVPS